LWLTYGDLYAVHSRRSDHRCSYGHTHHEIYGHFTCDDEAGPFQWTCAQPPFFLSLTAARTILHLPTWAPRWGPFFYLWLSINCGIGNNDSVRGPNCLVPPWSRTVGEPRTPRGSFISANGPASHRISMIAMRPCGQKKGPGDGDQPGPNNRVFRGLKGRGPENNVFRVAPFLFSQYITHMLWRSSRGRPLNAPAAFIHPCQPIVAKQPPGFS